MPENLVSVAPPGWQHQASPFHPGELAIQERLGVREKIDRAARRSIRDFLPEQHRLFYSQLPILLAGSVDRTGQPWASLLFGQPGFVISPDPKILLVRAPPVPGDILAETLVEGGDMGLLGIELPTRRRNRLNGTITAVTAEGFAVRVGQSFGNCPQYINSRDLLPTAPPMDQLVHRSERLDGLNKAIVAAADTLFIATAFRDRAAGPAAGVDVSHRGGRPGFVRVENDYALTIPDFVGNYFFNTLGNLVLDPRAGLLFIDFERGDLLQLSGRAEIIWSGEEPRAFVGAERLLRLHITQATRLEGALPLRWSAPAPSPLLARTGTWEETKRVLAATLLYDH